MANILIGFASQEGQTERVAWRVREVLAQEGHRVTLAPVSDDPDPADADAVVVAGPIHVGRHDPRLVAWARRRAMTLRDRPSALVTVCLTAQDDGDEARATLAGYDADLAEATGWSPDLHASVAGALNFDRLGWLKRMMLTRIARTRGLLEPDEPERGVHEFTDWSEVDALGHELAERLGHAA